MKTKKIKFPSKVEPLEVGVFCYTPPLMVTECCGSHTNVAYVEPKSTTLSSDKKIWKCHKCGKLSRLRQTEVEV